MTLESRLTTINGVGPARASQLAKLGLLTVRDLLWWVPRHYLDCRHPIYINEAAQDELVVIKGRVHDVTTSRSRRGQAVTRAIISDVSGDLPVVWFGQPFIADALKRPGERLLAGKIKYDRVTRAPTMMSATMIDRARLIPIYSVTKGLTSAALGKIAQTALAAVGRDELSEPWPAELEKGLDLPSLSRALKWLHQPDNPDQVRAARRRLAFDKLVDLQRGLWAERRSAEQFVSPSVPADVSLLKKYRQALPFNLTDGQAAAIWQLAQDLASEQPTRRLLNGDVGSGKTAVAAAGLLLAAQAGWQSVMLAPTDLLVQQHVETLRRLLADFRVTVGAITARQKDWSADILVGTHALWSADANFRQVGLVVIDEQHRFGVEQRDRLWNLTGAGQRRPHLLSLSATPIPRSLALTLYGGLSVTRLTDKPAGRQPIETRVINQAEIVRLLSGAVERGEQAYVVCPLIEEVELNGSLIDERQTVATVADEIKSQLPTARVGLLHGRQKPVEKDEVIGDFAAGKIDILVSTTVVEVGVDVPNATLMVIENAERFGIAQLHQLRGRVGRGDKPSICALVPRAGGQIARRRCERVASTNDGFILAEYDLKERGPGELIGLSQSGYQLDFIDELDLELIEAANRLAEALTK